LFLLSVLGTKKYYLASLLSKEELAELKSKVIKKLYVQNSPALMTIQL